MVDHLGPRTVPDLLAERSFPHAVDPDACTYCPFRPVCGDDAAAVSLRKLARAGGAAARFAALAKPEDDDGD